MVLGKDGVLTALGKPCVSRHMPPYLLRARVRVRVRVRVGVRC
jgi:hypothetical protein